MECWKSPGRISPPELTLPEPAFSYELARAPSLRNRAWRVLLDESCDDHDREQRRREEDWLKAKQKPVE